MPLLPKMEYAAVISSGETSPPAPSERAGTAVRCDVIPAFCTRAMTSLGLVT